MDLTRAAHITLSYSNKHFLSNFFVGSKFTQNYLVHLKIDLVSSTKSLKKIKCVFNKCQIKDKIKMTTLKTEGDFNDLVHTGFAIFKFDFRVSQKVPACHGFNMKTQGNCCETLFSLDDAMQSLNHGSFVFTTQTLTAM